MTIRVSVVDAEDLSVQLFKFGPFISDVAQLYGAAGRHISRIKDEYHGFLSDYFGQGYFLAGLSFESEEGRFVADLQFSILRHKYLSMLKIEILFSQTSVTSAFGQKNKRPDLARVIRFDGDGREIRQTAAGGAHKMSVALDGRVITSRSVIGFDFID